MVLITGSKGIYDMVVDGRALYSKYETGRHAEPGEILALLKQRLAVEVAPCER